MLVRPIYLTAIRLQGRGDPSSRCLICGSVISAAAESAHTATKGQTSSSAVWRVCELVFSPGSVMQVNMMRVQGKMYVVACGGAKRLSSRTLNKHVTLRTSLLLLPGEDKSTRLFFHAQKCVVLHEKLHCLWIKYSIQFTPELSFGLNIFQTIIVCTRCLFLSRGVSEYI